MISDCGVNIYYISKVFIDIYIRRTVMIQLGLLGLFFVIGVVCLVSSVILHFYVVKKYHKWVDSGNGKEIKLLK